MTATFAFRLYIATAATVICFLQIWLLVRKDIPDRAAVLNAGDANVADGTVKRQFSKDIEYMSLDHKFDHLWDQVNRSYSIVDPELDTGKVISVTIAMYVGSTPTWTGSRH